MGDTHTETFFQHLQLSMFYWWVAVFKWNRLLSKCMCLGLAVEDMLWDKVQDFD